MRRQGMRDGERARSGDWLGRLKAALPVVVTVALFAAGVFALQRLLSAVSLADVAAQVRSTPLSTLALAALATAAGYAALIGYDWSALRYIGKRLPARTVVLGGFLGYAFGNTIGLSAISGGAVRYRIYSAIGLDGYDVAAVATFASVAFGLGATVIGLGALALVPTALGALSPFPPDVVRLAALAGVAVIVLPLAAASIRRGAIRVGRFTVTAPPLPVLGAQVMFTGIDVTMSAMTLYLLLPSSDLGFATFLAIFAAATMAGVASHVPGGVGVFESVVVAALPATIPVEQAAAALLLYRAIYYLAPFALALALLALNEMRMAGLGIRGPAVEPVFRAVSAVAPVALATMVFASGLWMMLSTLVPWSRDAEEELELLLPLAFVEIGALGSSVLGVGLIVLADGLARRIEGAWWLAVGALAGGVVAAIADEMSLGRAAALTFALLVLLPCRGEFHRTARLTRRVFSPRWFALVAAVVVAVSITAFFAWSGGRIEQEPWWVFAVDQDAPRGVRAGLIASLMLSLALLNFALRAPRFAPQRPDAATLERAAASVASDDDPWAARLLTGDKALIFPAEGLAVVGFAPHGRSWVALGAPSGPDGAAGRAAWAFVDAAHGAGARPVFYDVGPESEALMLDLGLTRRTLGDEAVIGLPGFAAAPDSPLGRMLARGDSQGVTVAQARRPHAPALMAQLRRVSAAWVVSRGGRERGFAMARFDEAWVRRAPLVVARMEGRVVGFAAALRAGRGRAAAVDLLRVDPMGPGATAACLVAALARTLQAEGYATLSLGLVPALDEAARAGQGARGFGPMMYPLGPQLGGLPELQAFVALFAARRRPRFIGCAVEISPDEALADAAALIAGAR